MMPEKIKRRILAAVHSLFQIRVFELLLLPFIRGRYEGSRITICVPPHYTYSNPTKRIAKKDSLMLYANLYDYNDWKVYWSIKETAREHLYQLARHAQIVIDVGTNNGWVLMNIATIIRQNNGFIYGFEPHPETFKRCMKNIAAGKVKNYRVFNMGCGETETEYSMAIVRDSNSGQNRIIENDKEVKNDNIVTVKVTRLDTMFADAEKIDLIKIDVEGFELHTLKGAHQILKKHKPVLFIEIDDLLLRDNKTSPKEMLHYLQSNYNYTVKNAADWKIIDDQYPLDNCHLDAICFPEQN